jgi:chromosome segregation ATPase
MIGAAEDLEQKIAVKPAAEAALQASLATLTDQIEAIALELDQDKTDVEATRSLLAYLEMAYQQKAQELTQAKAHLQRAKAGGLLDAAR